MAVVHFYRKYEIRFLVAVGLQCVHTFDILELWMDVFVHVSERQDKEAERDSKSDAPIL